MAVPVLELEADFAGGTVDLIGLTRDSGWTITRGNTSLVSTGFVASAGSYQSTLNNRTRLLDPTFAAGAHFGDLVPGVGIDHSGTFAATNHPTFTGKADGWPQTWPNVGTDQVVSLHATDAVQDFANAQLSLTRPAEYSGARIQAIVDALGWPGPTAIAHGDAIVAALTQPTAVSWSHMGDVCAAEWGDLYVAADGTLTFRDRDQIRSEARSLTSQASFGTGGLKYHEPATMVELPIVNDCTITYGNDGNQVNSQDATSINSPWGLKSLPLTLPLQTATAAQQYADWIVARYKDPIQTFQTITIKPDRDPANLYPQVLGRELSDLITVTYTPGVDNGHGKLVPSTGITRTCWIRGILHAGHGKLWDSTTFYLQDASWISGLFIWDVSAYDGTDVWGL